MAYFVLADLGYFYGYAGLSGAVFLELEVDYAGIVFPERQSPQCVEHHLAEIIGIGFAVVASPSPFLDCLLLGFEEGQAVVDAQPEGSGEGDVGLVGHEEAEEVRFYGLSLLRLIHAGLPAYHSQLLRRLGG